MARRPFSRRIGPVGLALTLYDAWRRLPPKQRRRLLQLGREHAPRLAARALRAGRARAGQAQMRRRRRRP